MSCRTAVWLTHRNPYGRETGGAERAVRETCWGMVRGGWKVVVFTCGSQGEGGPIERSGLDLVTCSSWSGLHLSLPMFLREHADASIIIEDLAHVVPFGAEKFTKLPGVVAFRHLHRRTLPGQVSLPPRLLLSGLERAYPMIYKNWPIVAPSSSALSDLVTLGFPRERIHIIEYGVDTDLFNPGRLTPKPSLVHFAGLRPYKRPEHALVVLRILTALGQDVDLYLVGVGPSAASLARAAQKFGIADRVHFTGRLSDEQLARLVGSAWVHLQPAIAEGWGLTVDEAAAAGVPTVAYDVPGLRDAVIPGVTGQLVPDNRPDAMAEAVRRILADRSVWTDRCRRAVYTHSWKSVSAHWAEYLASLLDNK